MAVLPTPGSPINTGLFLVRRESTWIVRRISSSRPMTGSSLPSRAAAFDARDLVQRRLVARGDRLAVAARRADQIGAQPFFVVEQDLEQMLGSEALMAAAQRQALGRLDDSFRPLGIFLEIHDCRSDEPAAAPL